MKLINNKKVIKIFAIFIIAIVANSCTLFDRDEKLLVEHQKSNGEIIEVYYVSLGATTEDVIQVRKSKQRTPIWALAKYNYLKSSTLINDTSLQLILSDTGFNNNNNKLDTLIVNIK